jgi:hypothetical protein
MSDETDLRPPVPDDASGIPQDLRDGWIAFCDWRRAMSAAGTPLPPGGMCNITKNNILLDSVFHLRRAIALELRMPEDCVTITLDVDLGGCRPVVSVEQPLGWRGQLRTHQGERLNDRMVETYIQGVISTFYGGFKEGLTRRMRGFDEPGCDLGPREVIDCLKPE